jgi:hypothetical protein
VSEENRKAVPTTGSSPVSAAVGRREFLVAGGALALAPGWALAAATKGAPAAVSVLSVGYLLGSDALAAPRWPVAAPVIEGEERPFAAESIVVPAFSLSAGDPALAGGAVRIRIQGLLAGLERDVVPPQEVNLDVLVRDETGRRLPFHAWRWHRVTGASPPIRFRSWLDEHDPLVLELSLAAGTPGRRPAPAPGLRRRAELTLGKQDGLPRLQAGVYFLGFAGGVWDVERRLPGPGEPFPSELASVVMTVESVDVEE